MTLAGELGLDNRTREAAAALAVCELVAGRRADAAALVERVLGHLDAVGLDGAQEAAEICTNCWRVLSGLGDPRAAVALDAGAALLERLAMAIDDPELRNGALQHVPAHVALQAAIASSAHAGGD